MFQEMKLEDALKKFLQGKKVFVMHDMTLDPNRPTFTAKRLQDALDGWRFLVDLPAVEDMEFRQAVEEMMEQASALKECRAPERDEDAAKRSNKPEECCVKAAEQPQNAAQKQQPEESGADAAGQIKEKPVQQPADQPSGQTADKPGRPKGSRLDKHGDEIRKMLKEGEPQRVIAETLGVAQTTLSYWISKHPEAIQGEKKCPTCKYRSINTKAGNCNYIGITGHRRECSAKDCTRYEKGDPLPTRKGISLYDE